MSNGIRVPGRVQNKRNTTAYWESTEGFIPLPGEVIVYTDYKTIEKDGQQINVPGVKIGDGNAFVQHLPFVDDDLRERVLQHIADVEMHVTSEEKTFWNNKLNWQGYVEDGVLVFNRE